MTSRIQEALDALHEAMQNGEPIVIGRATSKYFDVLHNVLSDSIWRPIETAPKDRTWLLLHWPQLMHHPVVGYYDDKDEFKWMSAHRYRHQDPKLSPTHWKPLNQFDAKESKF
jgi:hypothetical protein